MDILLWAKRWHNKMSKMNGAFWGCLIVPIIILGQGKRVCWLVVGKCVKRKLSQIIFDQHWTVPEPSKHQSGSIETTFLSTKTIPDTSDRISKNPKFWLFLNRSSDFDPPRFNWQLPPRSMALKPRDTIWMDSFGPKDGIIKCQRWPNVNWGAHLFLSLHWVKAKGSVGWSVANVSKDVVPDQLWYYMDILLWAKRWHNKSGKMAELK